MTPRTSGRWLIAIACTVLLVAALFIVVLGVEILR